MTLSRRKAIALIGGGTVLAATTGATAFAMTRSPTAALAPWDAAGGYADVREHALSYALLAPNPHNLQPWMVSLEGKDRVAFWRDTSKGLPETDPMDRQIHIGFGCFLELARMAAAERGVAVETALWPDGPEGPVAAMTFRGEARPDPLFAGVMDRRSCKEPFADTPLTAAHAALLAEHATVVTDPSRVAEIVDRTWEAWLIEAHTPRTMRESAELMRIGRREIEANPDGIDLGGPMMEALALAGLMSREAAMDPESQGFKAAEGIYDEMLHATPAYAVMVAGDAPEDRIAVGRRWLRLNLATTLAGVSLHPVSQALQEFPEMAEVRARTHALLAPDGGTVQMLGRLGYGPDVPRTPRWPLEAKMV